MTIRTLRVSLVLSLMLAFGSTAFAQSSGLFPAFQAHRTQSAKASANRVSTAAPLPMPSLTGAEPAGTGQNYFGVDLGITSTGFYGTDNFFYAAIDRTNNIGTYLQKKDLGVGIGFILGGKVGLNLASGVDLEAKVNYSTNHSSAGPETYTDFPCPDPADPTAVTTVNNNYSVTLSNIGLSALLHVGFGGPLYGIGGVGFSSLLSQSTTLHQVLDPGQNDCSYIDRGTGLRSGINDFNVIVTDEGYNTSRTDLQIGIGSVFPLGTSTSLLDVELLLNFPFTKLLNDTAQATRELQAAGTPLPVPSNPSLLFATLTVGLRFPFGGGTTMPTAYDNSDNSSSTTTSSTTPAIGDDGKVALTGRVTNKSGDGVDATMTVVDLSNNEVVATDETDRNGNYNVRVKAPGKYSVTADANGYLFGTSYFEVDNQGRILNRHPNITLSEATTGRTRLLVFFDFDKATLQTASYPELNRAVRLMKAVPTMEVEIAGYTDAKGTDAYNKDLSLRRANAVKDYLVKNGIQKNRLTTNGYGADAPVASNDTDEGRAENRRVEFVVLKK